MEVQIPEIAELGSVKKLHHFKPDELELQDMTHKCIMLCRVIAFL